MKHYLACCSRDAVGRETELYLKIASEEFVAKGLMVLERNWLDIYQPWERWSTGQGELPRVAVGSRIIPTSLIMKDGQTNPPQLISEVELIALMDRNGIGKPDCCYMFLFATCSIHVVRISPTFLKEPMLPSLNTLQLSAIGATQKGMPTSAFILRSLVSLWLRDTILWGTG